MSGPAVSVIVVYNDEGVLDRRLRAGLARQRDVAWELLAVDNRGGRYRSAARALDDAAARAAGPWLLFAHQDVELLSATWLRDVLAALDPVADLGWAGAAGVDERGRFHGLLVDGGAVRGEYSGALEPVQTLDECLLLTRRRGAPCFDASLEGWHAYGVDACLDALRAGRRNVTLPFPVLHDSRGANLVGLQDARAWIVRKHGSAFPRIRTTTGPLPEMLDHPRGRRRSAARRAASRLRAEGLRLAGWRGGGRAWLGEVLERETENTDAVDVFRRPAPVGVLEASGFVHQPERRRSVAHRFGGGAGDARPGARRVVWHDRLAASDDPAADAAGLVDEVGALVVAELADVRPGAPLRRWLHGRARERTLARDLDGRRLAIYRIDPAGG